jgi:integrase/recombinase XerD
VRRPAGQLPPDRWSDCEAHEGSLLLLRYSSLRIGDAVRLERRKVQDNRLFVYTAQTGTPVHVPLPDFVVDALADCPNENPDYFFWSGHSALHTVTNKWRTRFAKLLKLAGLKGHFHMLRNSFAVGLLSKGVPIEHVSVLLGHSDTKITWRSYSPYVKSRQVALDEAVRRTW